MSILIRLWVVLVGWLRFRRLDAFSGRLDEIDRDHVAALREFDRSLSGSTVRAIPPDLLPLHEIQDSSAADCRFEWIHINVAVLDQWSLLDRTELRYVRSVCRCAGGWQSGPIQFSVLAHAMAHAMAHAQKNVPNRPDSIEGSNRSLESHLFEDQRLAGQRRMK